MMNGRNLSRCLSAMITLVLIVDADRLTAADPVKLTLRKRVAAEPQSGRFHVRHEQQDWDPAESAVIVCDMWDLHHCLNATRRGAELAPRMNEVLKKTRQLGFTIIHAPSSCMDAYRDHPARRNAQAVPRAAQLPEQITEWCYQIPSEEQGEYPIDQSDGGEDDDLQEHAEWAKKLETMGRNPRAPWKQQTDLLEIADDDFISDNGAEIWSILEQRGIRNVILLGVHTNMCVLGRPFGLRQMARNGRNVVLMRDMTDTMYNPLRSPHVSHFTGTDLIVAHIEKFVCPTVTSDQVLGGHQFRFLHDKRPRLLVVMAEQEYRTNETLPPFALSELGKHFSIDYVHANPDERNDLPGIELLTDADALLLSVRRRVLPPPQMRIVREFVRSGKPVIGIRTASHAFSLRSQPTPEGLVAWPEFDAEVFGGSYTNHHGNGPVVSARAAAGAEDHPILDGVDLESIQSRGSLYKVSPLKSGTTPLVIGSIPGESSEPVAWINKRKDGGVSFYTSLGHIGDFEQPAFRRLLRNAIYWSCHREVVDQVVPGE